MLAALKQNKKRRKSSNFPHRESLTQIWDNLIAFLSLIFLSLHHLNFCLTYINFVSCNKWFSSSSFSMAQTFDFQSIQQIIFSLSQRLSHQLSGECHFSTPLARSLNVLNSFNEHAQGRGRENVKFEKIVFIHSLHIAPLHSEEKKIHTTFSLLVSLVCLRRTINFLY